MDEKGATPFVPVNVYPRSTGEFESATSHEDEIRRKKRQRLFVYIAAFAVFQVVVILVFALVVMRAKSPEVEITWAGVEGLSVGNSSYNMTLIAQLKIKNKNFGDYKYERTAMNVSHGGVTVGEGIIWNGKAEARDTETVVVTATVNSAALSGDMSSRILVLESKAALRGKVHLVKMWGIQFQIMKKRKGAEMNCDMEINLTSGAVQDLDCDD